MFVCPSFSGYPIFGRSLSVVCDSGNEDNFSRETEPAHFNEQETVSVPVYRWNRGREADLETTYVLKQVRRMENRVR